MTARHCHRFQDVEALPLRGRRSENHSQKQGKPASCELAGLGVMGAVGFEHSANLAEKPGVVNSGGAKSGAQNPEIDAELTRVVNAWPRLAPDAKARILAIVEGKV